MHQGICEGGQGNRGQPRRWKPGSRGREREGASPLGFPFTTKCVLGDLYSAQLCAGLPSLLPHLQPLHAKMGSGLHAAPQPRAASPQLPAPERLMGQTPPCCKP